MRFKVTCSVGNVSNCGVTTLNKMSAKKIAAFKILEELKSRTPDQTPRSLPATFSSPNTIIASNSVGTNNIQ